MKYILLLMLIALLGCQQPGDHTIRGMELVSATVADTLVKQNLLETSGPRKHRRVYEVYKGLKTDTIIYKLVSGGWSFKPDCVVLEKQVYKRKHYPLNYKSYYTYHTYYSIRR